MYNTSILPNKLQSFNYYVNKLPLYLQNSNGFIEHYRIWYELMMGKRTTAETSSTGIVPTGDLLLYLLNIFDENYLDTIRDLSGSGSQGEDDYGTVSDILDKIGMLFGVKRMFSCVVEGVTYELTLNNEEFLILIKTQIIKNYFNGTFEQLLKYYRDCQLRVMFLTSGNATARVILIDSAGQSYSTNIQRMFNSGLLGVQSVGIQYVYSYLAMSITLSWDSNTDNGLWDVGGWDA